MQVHTIDFPLLLSFFFSKGLFLKLVAGKISYRIGLEFKPISQTSLAFKINKIPTQKSCKQILSKQNPAICHEFVIFPGETGMFATWRLSGNIALDAELCFGPAVIQQTRPGQCTWGLTKQKWVSMKGATDKRGELCQSDGPVSVCPPPHLPLHPPNPHFKVSE